MRPTVLLADDHRETAELLRKLLQSDFDVVELVEDGRALVSAAARLMPDVIVSDISMPGLDGIEAAVLILSNDPEARVVLVTVCAEPVLVERAFAAGVLGYVLKDAASATSAVRFWRLERTNWEERLEPPGQPLWSCGIATGAVWLCSGMPMICH